MLQALREMIAAAGALDSIELIGYVPYTELPAHYAWCDYFAGPSLHEPGPGNVYLEAMACGKPVIACKSGGAPEVVLDRQTGLLIPPHHAEALSVWSQDTTALTEAITTLTEDRELRVRLGKTARRWVEENFSVEKYIDRVESLYKELLS